MQIEKDRVVQFHCTITETGGKELQSTRDSDPMAYLHGHGGMFPGVEESLEGKQAGDQVEVTLPPEKTFGLVKKDAQQRISKKYLKRAGKYKVGDTVPLQSKDGVRLVTVLKVGHSMVDIDTNHPYAGKSLNFDITVVEVRDAKPEEKAHGHAHGPGGHHH